MAKLLGIVNIESATVRVEGVDDYRPASAASFLGRYRVLDFTLSNMTNSHINNIKLYIKNRPRSIVEHVQGTSYNINTKKGHIHILHGEKPASNEVYNTDVYNFITNMQFIEESNEPYVVIAPSHFVYIQDFKEMLNYHIESNSDITMLYQSVTNAKDSFVRCDTIEMGDGKRVTGIEENRGKYKNRDVSLECYIMSRNLFIELVEKAQQVSTLYWLRDIIRDSVKDLKITGYQHKGYVACINTLKAYYDANLELRDKDNLKQLFSNHWPIHTRSTDTCPTIYRDGANIKASLIGNGCDIEGTVINSVIGRGVVIKKGAVVKDSIILPSTTINKNVKIENAVVDRYAIINHVKDLKGTKDVPLYIKKGDRI